MDIYHPELDKDIADIHLGKEGDLGDLYVGMEILSTVDLHCNDSGRESLLHRHCYSSRHREKPILRSIARMYL